MKKLKLCSYLLFMVVFITSCEKETIDPIENSQLNVIKKNFNYPPTSFPENNKINIKAKGESNKSEVPCQFVNGSFESGDFTGWNIETSGEPLYPWAVKLAGVSSGWGFGVTAPQDGTYDAWNAFDGGGPMTFVMYQDLVICDCSELTWQDRIQWDYSQGSFASEPRTLEVQLRNPANNAIIATLYNFSTDTQDINLTGDTGWQVHNVDLSSYVGLSVRIYFLETIPQDYTGPAQIEFDDVSINSVAVCPTIKIDDCDTGVENKDLGEGIFMQHLINELIQSISTSELSNRSKKRKLVYDLNTLSYQWYRKGLISRMDRYAITNCALDSSIFYN